MPNYFSKIIIVIKWNLIITRKMVTTVIKLSETEIMIIIVIKEFIIIKEWAITAIIMFIVVVL